MTSKAICFGFAILLASKATFCLAQEVPNCGSLQNSYGPFDYRLPGNGASLQLVEAYHFTSSVEGLVAGHSGSVSQDLNYTLRAFPNHHRALDAVARYGLAKRPFGDVNIQSVECYFARAIAFQPDDAAVRVLYANYLFKTRDVKSAREQYDVALQLAPESAEISYNAGLFYLSVGDRSKAESLAKVAYDRGYPLLGLKNLLQRSGSSPDQGAGKSENKRP